MAFHRIWAVVLRYLYAIRDPSRLAEFVFWPIIDIGFYGFIASWFSSFQEIPNIVPIFVTGLVLWQVIYRANYEICVNVIDEFWEQNLYNMVATPLKPIEWALGMMLGSCIKMFFTLSFGSFVAWLFFGVNIFALGALLPILVVLCLFSGWITGFLAAGLLVYTGPKLNQLPWVTIAISGLFSTVYYPLSILPDWMQLIARSLPMTYIFETLREFLMTGVTPWFYLKKSALLCLFFLGITIAFFMFMFARSKKRGLPRLS
jgi:ABC-2 type transport system permease protein